MGRSYLPVRDNDLGQWAANFATLLSASPGVYGIVPADAANIATYVDAYASALAIVNNPGQKSASTVATKDGAKAAMLDIVRPYAMQIRNNMGVSNADKAALGLTIVDQTKTPIPPPISSPSLDVVAATRGEHLLRIRDASAPSGRGKPFGTIGMQLFVAMATTPVDDPNAAAFKSFVTRAPCIVKYDSADSGKVATYHARWQNSKGEIGPWSNPVSFLVYA